MKALIMSEEGFEDSEVLAPYYRLLEAGLEVDVAAISKGPITGKHGYQVEANTTFKKVRPGDYSALIIPGGRAPERVRISKDALRTVKQFMKDDMLVASICHGPQVMISAGVLDGRKGTGWKGIQDDMKAAGVRVMDKEVVVDGNWISSRQPEDLPAFNREIMNAIGIVK
ncbi:MAG: DJ-1/PfpI/YhbO family deglycase/protease [Candidatus Altiarchaeales archaeon]|nr:DJ-1/PfpI/YhbO family deglycase/protease [Candidatus Altiarchaeales archaeon]MBD3416873.1 DJ-1/PfpI/YhbO family deglycase/protease [Candidatus Altiarchaeales archaeon]